MYSDGTGEPLTIQGRGMRSPPSAPLSVNSQSEHVWAREAETLGSKFNMLFVGIRCVCEEHISRGNLSLL